MKKHKKSALAAAERKFGADERIPQQLRRIRTEA